MVSGNPKTNGNSEDQVLIAAVLTGDRQAFSPLVQRHHKAIYNFAYRYTHSHADAEDLTQEAFLHAFRALNTFKPNRSFRNWLFAIAANKCRDWTRWKKARPQPDAERDPDELWEEESSPPRHVLKTEQTEELAQAISALPADYKAAVILFHIQEMSQRQIAEILDLPISVVKNRLYRARLMLRKALKDSGGEIFA